MASVDVVVPCYQYGRFLRECVTSVLTQDFRNVRVLIIDNASTDNTLEIAKQLAYEDRRVEVIAHATNLGHHASFNEGIDWASAEYFILLFADDMLAEGCLTRAVSFMERHRDVAFTCGRALPLDADQPRPRIEQPGDVRWRVETGRGFIERFCRTGLLRVEGSTLLVRTSAQKRAGHYRTTLPYSDDWEVWLRLACLGNVAETDTVQGFLRCHGQNRSVLKNKARNQDLLFAEAAGESFFENEGGLLHDGAELRRAARRALGQRAYWSAVSNLVRGDRRLALDLFKFAFSRCPSSAILPPLNYLFRREDSFRRIGQVAQEIASTLRGGIMEFRRVQ